MQTNEPRTMCEDCGAAIGAPHADHCDYAKWEALFSQASNEGELLASLLGLLEDEEVNEIGGTLYAGRGPDFAALAREALGRIHGANRAVAESSPSANGERIGTIAKACPECSCTHFRSDGFSTADAHRPWQDTDGTWYDGPAVFEVVRSCASCGWTQKIIKKRGKLESVIPDAAANQKE
jgi:hypothetical protein